MIARTADQSLAEIVNDTNRFRGGDLDRDGRATASGRAE